MEDPHLLSVGTLCAGHFKEFSVTESQSEAVKRSIKKALDQWFMLLWETVFWLANPRNSDEN